MKQKMIAWLLVLWFGAILSVQILVTPGLASHAVMKFIPFSQEAPSFFYIFFIKHIFSRPL